MGMPLMVTVVGSSEWASSICWIAAWKCSSNIMMKEGTFAMNARNGSKITIGKFHTNRSWAISSGPESNREEMQLFLMIIMWLWTNQSLLENFPFRGVQLDLLQRRIRIFDSEKCKHFPSMDEIPIKKKGIKELIRYNLEFDIRFYFPSTIGYTGGSWPAAHLNFLPGWSSASHGDPWNTSRAVTPSFSTSVRKRPRRWSSGNTNSMISSKEPGFVILAKLKPSISATSTHRSSSSTTVFGLPTAFALVPPKIRYSAILDLVHGKLLVPGTVVLHLSTTERTD